MKKIPQNIAHFLNKQGFLIVSTIDCRGRIHCAAKGNVHIARSGKVYLVDLYKRTTYRNLMKNHIISVTAVDEEKFEGYSLKGKARVIDKDKIKDRTLRAWEEKAVQRITTRMIRNIRRQEKGAMHPESYFPPLQHVIIMEVNEIVDLTPRHIKRSSA